MDFDPDLWLLSVFGAGLLLAGGAALRSLLLSPAAGSQISENSRGHEPSPTDDVTESFPDPASPAFVPFEGFPVPDEASPERNMAYPPTPSADLATVHRQLAQSEAAREALRLELIDQRQRGERHAQAAQSEIQRLAAEFEAEKARLCEALAALERSLEDANAERDGARAKAEALERLVEGVRARSRELAAELKALKDS